MHTYTKGVLLLLLDCSMFSVSSVQGDMFDMKGLSSVGGYPKLPVACNGPADAAEDELEKVLTCLVTVTPTCTCIL